MITKKGTDNVINLSYKYDKMNRLWKVFEDGSVVATYLYDKNGNRKSLQYPNGNSTVYEYNAGNRLTSLTNKNGTNVISQYQYTYYLDGNQATKDDKVAGIISGYVYDGLGRLYKETVTEGQVTSSEITYIYDDYNNRKSMSIVSGGLITTTEYLYDKNNRLLIESKVSNNLNEKNI